MNEFLDFCEKAIKAESADNCCHVKTASEYLGVSPFPENTVTTMAYVPFQTDTTMYDVETGYKNGTVFSDLNKPFLGGRSI